MARARIHNGVDLTALSDLIAEVKANPELGKLQVQAHAQWQGGGRCVIRLSPPGENGGTESPPFSIAADSLSSLVADQGAANAGQLLLAALASDLVAGFVRNASQRGIRIESLDIETDGVLELDHQLGLRESPDEGLGGISVNLRVDADNNVEQLEDLLSEAQQISPIISLLRTSGLHLGPVGGRIVGEVFIGLLQTDPKSFLNVQPDFKPLVPTRTGRPEDFHMVDFLTFAGVDPASRGQ